jgi:hypothetical protein
MSNPQQNRCRCGYVLGSQDPHPCHRCGTRPGQPCFREQESPYSLAGAQDKINAIETWACPECRKEFAGLGGNITGPRG